MAGPLFWPKMVSAGPQFSIIRPKTCLPFQLIFFLFFIIFFFFISAVAQIAVACSVNLPEGVKDGRYKNNHENDTCIVMLLDFDGLSFEEKVHLKCSLIHCE